MAAITRLSVRNRAAAVIGFADVDDLVWPFERQRLH
jgi:hypothetical protein